MAKDARGYDNKPDTGVLFKNTDKTKDTDPDYRGSGKVGGCDYWISGWVNTSQNGTKFMSLKMKPKAGCQGRDHLCRRHLRQLAKVR